MAYDELEIGATPAGEDCQYLGTPSYDPIMAKKECRAFVNQLKRQFGEPPMNARFKITSNPHDFGTYYEVAVRFDEDDEEAVDYAYKVEAESPKFWDDEAKKELGLIPNN